MRTAKCFDNPIREAEGSAPLHCRVIQEMICMMGCPEEQQSRSFASHLEHGKGTQNHARAQDDTLHEDRHW